MARADERSILGQRVQLTWGLRMTSHAALALGAFRRTGAARWLVAGAAAVAGDAALTAALQRAGPRARWRLVVDAVDVAVWSSAAGPDVGSARAVHIGTAVPPAVEAGFRFGAGDRAIPVPEPARPFPPPRWLGPLADVVAPTAVAVAAAAVARRRRGFRAYPGQGGWGLLAGAAGFGVARLRDRLQSRARIEWAGRASRQVRHEQQVTHVRLATRSTPGHDFKKVLAALGYWGSERARMAALAQMEHPGRVVRAPGGTTLGEALAPAGVRVDPPSAGTHWVSDAQAGAIRRFVDDTDGAGPPVLAVANTGASIQLDYLGHGIELVNEPPPLAALLDPIPIGLALGAVWKLAVTAGELGGVARGPAVVGAGIDAASLVAHHLTRRPDMRPHAGVVTMAVASAAVVDAAIMAGRGRSRSASGIELFPATMATGGLFVVAARYWESGARLRTVAFSAGVALWLLASTVPTRRSWGALLQEANYPLAMTLAVVGLGRRIGAEAEELEMQLQADFDRQVAEARHAAVVAELARHEGQVDLAVAELARLRDRMPADVVDAIEAECETVRAWLADPRTVMSLVS